jgi:hypothetical protein
VNVKTLFAAVPVAATERMRSDDRSPWPPPAIDRSPTKRGKAPTAIENPSSRVSRHRVIVRSRTRAAPVDFVRFELSVIVRWGR